MRQADREIWRTARMLIEEHCHRAAAQAARHIDAAREQGDAELCREWSRVYAAINEIRRIAPRQDERVN